MGHLIAAAGVTEMIVCLLAMRDSVLPPTINLENPDPDCDLDYVPNQARPSKIRAALNNSFGFGGQNVTLALGSTLETVNPSDITDDELLAYLHEELPEEELVRIEAKVRTDPIVRQRLECLVSTHDVGARNVGAVWRRHRLSCPSRETLGSFLLNVLIRTKLALSSFISPKPVAFSANPTWLT